MDKVCPVCSHLTKQSFLEQRPDYEYGTTTTLQYWKCRNKRCGLVFADPLPPLEIIGSFYKKYTTHISNVNLSKLNLVSRINIALADKKLKDILRRAEDGRTKILDYGCGNGNLLLKIKSLGITGGIGYDFDPVACSYATSIGLEAYDDMGEVACKGPFDYIFLNHVVEHLYTLEDLAILHKLLAPGGMLIVRTPNSGSFLSYIFGVGWRGWETPRHLQIFNSSSLRLLCERTGGLTIKELSTSNLIFPGVFYGSFHTDFFVHSLAGKILRRMLLFILLPLSLITNFFFARTGEELVLLAMKND